MHRLLITVAHPDDETFGTGSVIAAAAEAGAEVTVCCATRGEAGEAHGLAAGADLAAVREAELRAAGASLGATRFVVLDYLDSDMTGEPAPGTLAAADDVVDRVRAVIDDVDPDVVVTLDPDHGDGHRDHEVIGRATLEACRGRSNVRVYAWTVARPLLARWLTELREVRPGSAHLEIATELDEQGLGRPEADITTVIDVAHLRPARERAIAMHATQVAPYEGMPEELRAEFLETDRLVRLLPPWDGGPVERSLF
jgi:LmbE family N-acetylglucosaminyl deacetylase